MLSETSKKIKEKFGKKSYKTYAFFLGFTTFLWLALQFSKNYSQEITFKVKYNQIETAKLVKPSSDQEINMVLEGNGFQLLKYSLFNKTVKLDARKAISKNKNHAFFTGKPMINAIKSGLNYTGEISFVLKDSLHIYYDVFKEKEIPVKLVSDISYAQGFMSAKGLISTQKTIKVMGPKSVMDTLAYISTEVLSLENVTKDYQGKLTLKPNKQIGNLSFDVKKIPVTLSVDKLTEGEIKVPISVLEIPKGAKIQLFPKQVSVVFSVVLKDHAKLSTKDFKVVADLSHASGNSNKLLLKLTTFPENVFNARLTEKEVQYIVVK